MNGLLEMFAISFSFIAMLTAIAALCMTIGMKLSTHRIEWKTIDYEKFEEEGAKDDEDDSDAVLKRALDLQRKKNKQEDPLDTIAETSNF